MYNYIWKKYLPFINIQLKRSAGGDQVLNLNRIDFERAGTGRKAGYKFTIEFIEGRIGNIISNSPLASNLAAVMLENEATKEILRHGHYTISLNTKFQLTTTNCNAAKNSDEETPLKQVHQKNEIADSQKSE
jgi:hypothetical protein